MNYALSRVVCVTSATRRSDDKAHRVYLFFKQFVVCSALFEIYYHQSDTLFTHTRRHSLKSYKLEKSLIRLYLPCFSTTYSNAKAKKKREHNQREAFDFSPRKENFSFLFSPDDGKVFTRFQLRKIVVFCSRENGEDVERGFSLSGALFTTFLPLFVKVFVVLVVMCVVVGLWQTRGKMANATRFKDFCCSVSLKVEISFEYDVISENTRSSLRTNCSALPTTRSSDMEGYGNYRARSVFPHILFFFLIWL